MPEGDAAAARLHARDCETCAASLEAALELEVALGAVAAAPAGFTDRVMARVAATPQGVPPAAALAPAALPASPFPWWVRAAMDPAVLLAASLAALLGGWGAPILRAGVGAQEWLMRAIGSGAATTFRLDPEATTVVALVLLPSLAWASWRIYRWSEGLASRAADFRGSPVS